MRTATSTNTATSTPAPNAAPVEQASGFSALTLPEKTSTASALKASEGSRITEPFRVAGALAGTVFKAAHAMYDNVRTDIRVANAAKEMATFDVAKISKGASAKEILDTWKQMADSNQSLTLPMKHLSRAAAKIVGANNDQVQQLRGEVSTILKGALGDGKLTDFTGPEGAKNLASLTPQQKRDFLGVYDKLRDTLNGLNAIAQNAEAQARAFYESSVERFQAQSNFNVGTLATKFYNRSLTALQTEHVKALNELKGADPTPDKITEIGKNITLKITELQKKTTSLNASLEQAANIDGNVKKTLGYLTDGIDKNRAVEFTDSSVVFVGAKAANKIADWIRAQTKDANAELKAAKRANDPLLITTATEKLAAASEAVHKQLDDIATLLSKVNGGKDAKGAATQDQRDRILAKALDAGITDTSSFEPGLSAYVKLLRSQMESRIAKMFTAKRDGSYDLSEGRKGLAIIDRYDDMLERTIAAAAADGLEAHEVTHAVEKIHAMLQDELNPPPPKLEKTRIDAVVEATRAAKDKELAPRKTSLWGTVTNWLFKD
jgi:hypothetical protein